MNEKGKPCVPLEVLPLVEFQLEPGISDEEAVNLIEAPTSVAEESNQDRGWLQTAGDTFQTMQFDDSSAGMKDPFTARLMNYEVCYLLCYN
jgi:intraflagellar transport protein 122